ncbi:MAG: hypothetical protein ACLFPV_04210 [Spirochaetaceae bacterium]
MRKARLPLFLFLVLPVLSVFGQAQEFPIQPPPGTYHREVSLEAPEGSWEFRFEGNRLFRKWDRPLTLSTPSGDQRSFLLEVQPTGNPAARQRLSYTVDRLPPAAPQATPVPGIYSEEARISLAAPEGRILYQVLPSSGEPVEYRDPIVLPGNPGTVTSYEIQALSVDSQGNSGPVETYRYVIDRSEEEDPYLEILSPVPGRFANRQLLYIASRGYDEVRYSLDGTDPRKGGDRYVGPVLIARDGPVELSVVGMTTEGAEVEESVSYQSGNGSLVSAAQGYHKGPLFVDAQALRTYRYRLDDAPVSRTDAVFSRTLEIRPIPGTLRSVVLRLNDSPESDTPDYRYTFVLDSREVLPPSIHLFVSENDRVNFALERDAEVETEYVLSVNGRPYRSGTYTGPVSLSLPSGVEAGEGVVRARSRSGSGAWSAYAEERFTVSTTTPDPVRLEVRPEGPAPAKEVLFDESEDRVVRYELRRVTEPARRVTERSGRLENGAMISIPFGTRERFVLSYAVFDPQGAFSEERSVELVLDHEPPADPEISVDNRILRVRGGEDTYYRVVPDDVSEIPPFENYRGPVELPVIAGRRVGYSIEAYGKDSLGNTSAVVSRRVFVDDRPLEVPEIVGVEDGGRYARESVSISPALPSPGLSVHYTLSTDGTDPPLPTEGSPVLEEPLEVFGAEGEAVVVRLRLRVRSRETGRFGSEEEIRFVIDREPPLLPNLIGVENNGVYRGSREVSVTDFESDSRVFLLVSEAEEPDAEARRIPYRGPFVLDVSEGSRREFLLTVEIVDSAGNTTRSAFPIRVVIDRQVPRMPVLSLDYHEGRPMLRLEGGDGDLFYSLTRAPDLPEVPGKESERYTGPIPLGPGRYFVTAREIDPAGNRSAIAYSSEIFVPAAGEVDQAKPVVLTSWSAGTGVLIWPYAHRRKLFYRLPFLTDSRTETYDGPREFSLPEGLNRVVVEYSVGPQDDLGQRISIDRPTAPGTPEVDLPDGYRARDEIEVIARGEGTLRYELSTSGSPGAVSRRSPEWPGTLRLPGRDGEVVSFNLAFRSFTPSGPGEEVRRTFVVDRAPPSAPRLVNAEDGEFYDETRQISLETDEGEVFYRLVRNPRPVAPGEDFLRYQGPLALDAVSGELSHYRIEAYSLDDVGNRSPNTAVWNVYIDREIIYVAPDGSDRGSGSRESPFQTLGRAVEYARESDRGTIFLSTGVYEISAPLRSREALAIQGRFDPETWRPRASGETLIIPGQEFAGDALVASYGGSVTMSRLALSSSPSFTGALMLLDDAVTRLDSVSLSTSGGHAVDARGGNINLRRVTLDQSGTTSEAVVLRGTAGSVEDSVLRAGSFGNDRAVVLDTRESASLTVDGTRIEAYGISRATAVSATNSSVEITGSTIRVGASRGNAQAVIAADGGVLVERTVLQADDQTRVANLLVSRDGTLAVIDSLLELSGNQGAVGVVASGGRIDVQSSRFVGTSLNDFTYGIQARGVEGIFVNNVFQAGQVGEYIAGSLVDSPTQWIHNTFLGYRASPFIQLLNIRGHGETLFGNNLALQGARGAGTGLVVSGSHRLELTGNLFGGWSSIVATDERELSSLGLIESGRVEGIVGRNNDLVPLDEVVGRDGVPYRLFPDSPAIDRAVELPGAEAVLLDIEGQRRPAPVPPDGSFRRAYEGRPDVGADEYYP